MTNSENKFRNDNGELTAYAFACGYIEKEENGSMHCQLMYETPTYFVKIFNATFPYLEWNNPKGGRFWLCYDKLSDARSVYRRMKSMISRGEWKNARRLALREYERSLT